MRTVSDILYGKIGDPAQKLDLYLPEKDSFPVFVYFHGGGIERGDKAAQGLFCEYMTSHGAAVVSANYRMYPKAKYPEFLDDAAEAVAWTFANIGKYGKAEGIFVGGSSAGGYISMMLCFDRSYLEKQGIKVSQITGFIHDAGQPTVHFNVLRERGVDTRRVIVDEAAPLYFIGADKEYPPMLIIVSDNDMQNRYEQTVLVMSTLKHFGHEGPKVRLLTVHGDHCAYIDEADEKGDSVFGKMVLGYIKSI